MNKLSIFLFFGILLSSNSVSSQDEINQVDAQGQNHGMWKKMYPGTNQLRYEGQFEHGTEVGVFKFYCEECKGHPTVTKTFTGNGIAEVKYFTAKGKLVSEGKMKDKDRIEEWVYYHKDSKNIMTKENYVKGKLEGRKITFYPNGKVTEEIEYFNGQMNGEDNYYSPAGVLLKKLQNKDGQLHGPAFYYDASGTLVIEGFYKGGKKHGLWKYYKNGKVVLEETYPKEQTIGQ